MSRNAWLALAAVVVLALAWALWPSGLSRVRNLGSHGTNIIAFGDSLTAGYGASAGEDWPTRLSALLSRPIANAGLSGDTTESALSRVEPDVLAHDPRIVLVGLGGNDFLGNTPIATTEANLRTIVRQIQDRGAAVVLLSFRFPSITSDYDAMYKRVAKEERCYLIEGVLSGILTDQSLKSDEIHPNAKGYALMAERLAGPMRKMLRKADAAREGG